MKKIILNVTLLCSLFFLFTNCKKDEEAIKNSEPKLLGDIRLGNAELNIIPYLMNDSIVLKDSIGNSKNFKVLERRVHSSRMHKNGGTDETTDYYNIETLNVTLSENNGLVISILLEAPLPDYCSTQNENKNYFMISFYPPYNMTPPMSHTSFANYIDTTNFYYSYPDVLPITFHNTITILNKTYDSVYELALHGTANTTNDFVRKVYYNKTNGIVGIQMESGERWCLEN